MEEETNSITHQNSFFLNKNIMDITLDHFIYFSIITAMKEV